MSANYKSQFSSQRTFQDVTNERADVLRVTASLLDDANVRVYERKGTVILHSKKGESNHASVSSAQRQVQEWEIVYAIERILRTDYKNVTMIVGGNGVIHLYAKEKGTLFN